MAGPWEKYVGSSDTSGSPAAGPWQKYGSADATPSASGKASADERPVGAFAEAAGNMMGMGYLPQIKAALVEQVSRGTFPGFPSSPIPLPREKVLAAIDRPIGEVLSGDAFKNLKPLNSYVETRDAAAGGAKELADANPVANVAGAVTGVLAPMGAETAVLKGLGVAKGASAGARIAQAGIKGAVTAGLFNPGDKEGEIAPIQLDKRIEQAEVGGLLSMLMGGAGELASKGSSRVAGAEGKIAADLAESGELAPAASEGEALKRTAGARAFSDAAVSKAEQMTPIYKGLVGAAEDRLGRTLTEPELFEQHKLARAIVENGAQALEGAAPAAAEDASTKVIQPTKDALEKLTNSKALGLLSLLGGVKSYGAFKALQKFGPSAAQKAADAISNIDQTGITPGVVGGALVRRLSGGN